MVRISHTLQRASLAALLLATQVHGAQLKSAAKLAFDASGTLYIADWKAARIYAVKVPAASVPAATPFNLRDVQKPIAAALKVREAMLRFDDLVVQPGSGTAYVSVSAGARVAVVAVDASGKVRPLPTGDLKSFAPITDAPAAGQTFWRDLPAPALTVTDMKYHDGKLYLSGLSNRNFASALRVFDLPFNGAATSSTATV